MQLVCLNVCNDSVTKFVLLCFSELNLEKEVLQEQCQRLHKQVMDRRQQADTLGRHLGELLAIKRLLDCERHQVQQTLDHLNTCLRKLR